jgi:hypothetical protein
VLLLVSDEESDVVLLDDSPDVDCSNFGDSLGGSKCLERENFNQKCLKVGLLFAFLSVPIEKDGNS